MLQNSVKAKNTGSWKSARFQSFELENDAQDAEDQYADVIMPFVPDAHAARTIEDKSKAEASAEEQQDVEQQDEANQKSILLRSSNALRQPLLLLL
jgi:hypothetical protein